MRSATGLRLGAIALFCLALCLFVVGGTLLVEAMHRDRLSVSAITAGILVTKILPCAVALGGIRLLRLASGLRAKSYEEIVGSDKRRPVLYLRSFQDDGAGRGYPFYWFLGFWFSPLTAWFHLPRASTEQQIATVAHGIGPLIAIGKPNESYPELGAARLYIKSEQWRERVLELLRTSQLVIVRVGLTGGVCWELQKTFEVVPLNRLILSLQPEKSIWRRRQLVRQFHETNILPVPINMVGDFPFVYFDENRTPHGATRLTGALKELRIGQDVEV